MSSCCSRFPLPSTSPPPSPSPSQRDLLEKWRNDTREHVKVQAGTPFRRLCFVCSPTYCSMGEMCPHNEKHDTVKGPDGVIRKYAACVVCVWHSPGEGEGGRVREQLPCLCAPPPALVPSLCSHPIPTPQAVPLSADGGGHLCAQAVLLSHHLVVVIL